MNFLIFMSDEHNPFISSVYGHQSVQTPNMQRLAERGTVFENAYCNSPLCLPSRSSFMSGRYVHDIQVYNNSNAGLGDFPSYGKILADQGVHTAYAGKTDVYVQSNQLGFSEMMVPRNRKFPGDHNITRKPAVVRQDAEKRGDGFGPRDDAFQQDDQVIARCDNWLKETAPGLAQPWSLTVNTLKPHFPHYVTQELWDLYSDCADLPPYDMDCPSANHPCAKSLRKHFQTEQFTEAQIRGLRRGYYGCVTWVDRALGRLLDTLESTGQLDDTVVVYCSDHGEMLGKFGMWWKNSLYEDAVRVPLIVAGSGFAKSKRINTPVSLVDLQASLFQSLGAKRPSQWQGQPLQHIRHNDKNRLVFSEYHAHGTSASGYMLRQGPWKMMHYIEAPDQLFNLEDDPDELVNLASANPDKLNQMLEALSTVCNPNQEQDRCENFIKKQLSVLNGKA